MIWRMWARWYQFKDWFGKDLVSGCPCAHCQRREDYGI